MQPRPKYDAAKHQAKGRDIARSSRAKLSNIKDKELVERLRLKNAKYKVARKK